MARSFVVAALLAALLFGGCSTKPAPAPLSAADSARILQGIAQHRADADAFFSSDPDSPFAGDTSVHYDGIKWFPPDVGFVVRSKLHRYDRAEPVTIYGTKGEARKELRYGYFEFTLAGKELRLNVYKATPEEAARNPRLLNYLSVWFTDETTGKETYEVGRYLDVGEERTDPEALYELDFNAAYNPYCSYSARYSCAIPTKDDHLAIAVRAGERKYHP